MALRTLVEYLILSTIQKPLADVSPYLFKCNTRKQRTSKISLSFIESPFRFTKFLVHFPTTKQIFTRKTKRYKNWHNTKIKIGYQIFIKTKLNNNRKKIKCCQQFVKFQINLHTVDIIVNFYSVKVTIFFKSSFDKRIAIEFVGD